MHGKIVQSALYIQDAHEFSIGLDTLKISKNPIKNPSYCKLFFYKIRVKEAPEYYQLVLNI